MCGDFQYELFESCNEGNVLAQGGNAYVNGNMGGSVSTVEYKERKQGSNGLGGFGGGGMGK